MHAADLIGKPDFVFREYRLSVFVDGCFWHGCAEHRGIPQSNHVFWSRKIRKNRQRDQLVTARLEGDGWKVLRFWEHDISQNPSEATNMIASEVAEERQSSGEGTQ